MRGGCPLFAEDGTPISYDGRHLTKEGAVAAPTAGLHFTPELLDKLKAKGVQFAYVTLHVGAGTFLPVKVEDVTQHKMHSEWGQVSADAAADTIDHLTRYLTLLFRPDASAATPPKGN